MFRNYLHQQMLFCRKKWCPQKAAGKKQEMGSESWVFTRSGCIFSPDAMKKFIRGSTALLISSLGHSETRQIFEYLYTVFETIVEEEVNLCLLLQICRCIHSLLKMF